MDRLTDRVTGIVHLLKYCVEANEIVLSCCVGNSSIHLWYFQLDTLELNKLSFLKKSLYLRTDLELNQRDYSQYYQYSNVCDTLYDL